MPSDDTLWLYTSLTAGSSHIITATSRIETILKANKIPFKAVDIATNEKARLIWQRRSKGKKIPGLVKFNDVVADLEQIEEWNEYGELEDELEAIIDIFGDVPVSSTSAEAHAAAAERANAQAQQAAGGSSQARTASETRHISISDPKSDKKKDDGINKNDTPMSMAMRQAGAEAAAKAGQKSASIATSTPATGSVPIKTPEDVNPPETKPAATASTTLESEESSTVTDAKTPVQLASEGGSKTILGKIATADPTSEAGEAAPSTMAQTLSQSRKASVPNNPSSLAKSTSISESHTMSTSASASSSSPSLSSTTSGKTERPRTQHRGSDLEAATPETIKEIEKRNSIAEVDEEDDEDEDEDEDEEESSEEEEVEEQGAAKKLKTGTGATDKEEKKVMGGTKTQEQGAKDGESAGVSVGD